MPKSEREEFIRQVYEAYRALAITKCHRLCPPGIKGLQEQLLCVVEVSHAEMMQVVCPGWPNVSVEDEVSS